MKLLLDTHAFLWFILDDVRLTSHVKAAIGDRNNNTLVSPASYWELAIKIGSGKLALQRSFDPFIAEQISRNHFSILHIEPRHTSLLTTLPFHHRDPFDRLLVAQALVEKIAIVSADSLLDQYGVSRIW